MALRAVQITPLFGNELHGSESACYEQSLSLNVPSTSILQKMEALANLGRRKEIGVYEYVYEDGRSSSENGFPCTRTRTRTLVSLPDPDPLGR